MKKTTLTVLALAVLLTGCAKSADSAAAANADVQMRVQDGYIQYYNGTDWENLIATAELKGDPGEKGDKGDKGDQGEPGEKGERGATGPKGAKGDKGDKGEKGDKGDKGDPGTNGADGLNGANGKDGTNGKDGRDGINGKDGASAIPGITQEFICTVGNYYSMNAMDDECGYIQIGAAKNVLFNQRRTVSNSSGNPQQISVLMNEDGQFAVTAVAESGWQFVKWSDGQTNPSRTVTYTDNTSLCAYFEPVTPLISWNSITPLSSGSVAELSHPYSASEPWLDILYIGDMWIDSQSLLGGGIYVDKGENDQLGKYISVKHSTTTTIRYGGLAVYPSRDLNTYIDGRVLSLALYAQSGQCADLRIQVLVDGVVVDPETVLPALSTVDWLYAKGEAPRPTPTPTPYIAEPEPTEVPTPKPTATATPTPYIAEPEPTEVPTPEPTPEPTPNIPEPEPTEVPTPEPTPEPTPNIPEPEPTEAPPTDGPQPAPEEESARQRSHQAKPTAAFKFSPIRNLQAVFSNSAKNAR